MLCEGRFFCPRFPLSNESCKRSKVRRTLKTMLFGKKSSLAPEERRERVQAIERLVNADRDDEAFRLPQALEKEEAAALAMACFYTMGENVQEDHAAARHAPKEGLFRPVRLKEREPRRAAQHHLRRRQRGAHPPELRQLRHRQHRRRHLPLVLKQPGPAFFKRPGLCFCRKLTKKEKFVPVRAFPAKSVIKRPAVG